VSKKRSGETFTGKISRDLNTGVIRSLYNDNTNINYYRLVMPSETWKPETEKPSLQHKNTEEQDRVRQGPVRLI